MCRPQRRLYPNFNPLRREGGDVALFANAVDTLHFNPLRREGGDTPWRSWILTWKNFNPLRREGGDESGVTDVKHYVHFNPLRREGGDVRDSAYDVLTNLFQSTPPRGRRPYRLSPEARLTTISIHSAARAETRPSLLCIHPCENFNPLRREGGDLGGEVQAVIVPGFQSTPPRGRRHTCLLFF